MIIHATSADGRWDVIQAYDYAKCPPGTGRSRTRKTPGEALQATWEPNLFATVGPGSWFDYVLVRSMDIKGLPDYGKPRADPLDVVAPTLPTGRVIPNYPHKCHVCGGRTLELFSSVEHEGVCPGRAAKAKPRRF